MNKRGIFITLEGIDGSGKSTQFRQLVKHLRRRGLLVTATREPGGTRLGEQIRRIVLGRHAPLAPLTELALMYAARAQLLEEAIRDALERGEAVLSDRFNDASMAYQGYGRGLGTPTVKALDQAICGKTQPDLTIVLDLDPRVALKRARGRELRRNSRHMRFERQNLKFHHRVRRGYLAMARREPRRVKIVRADRPVGAVQAEIRKVVDTFLERRRKL